VLSVTLISEKKRSNVSKTFSNLPGHYKLIVEYDLHFFYVDTLWDEDEFIRLKDDEEIIVETTSTDGTDDVSCFDTLQKSVTVKGELDHDADEVYLIIDTNLKFAGCYSHSWGINNFKISVEPCALGCNACSGGEPGDCT